QATGLTLTGYALIPGDVQTVDLRRVGPPGNVSAQVIGSARNEASALYGPGDIVFINKGSADGVAVGQLLDLYFDRSIRDSATPIPFSKLQSGMLKVAKVSGNCATAVVVSAVDSIQQGDRVEPQMARGAGPGKSNEVDSFDVHLDTGDQNDQGLDKDIP